MDAVCPWCERPAWRVPARFCYQRGEKSLTVEVEMWQCKSGCESPRNGGIYTFTDTVLDGENTKRADAAWRKAFGQPFPSVRLWSASRGTP